jgi:hypothetical protein
MIKTPVETIYDLLENGATLEDLKNIKPVMLAFEEAHSNDIFECSRLANKDGIVYPTFQDYLKELKSENNESNNEN